MSELLKEALRFLDGADALIDTAHPTDDEQQRARADIAEAVERITAAMLPSTTTIDTPTPTDGVEFLDAPEDRPPHRVDWGIVGAVTVGGYRFPLRRIDYVDQPDVSDFTTHSIDVGPGGRIGEVDIDRSGADSEGPWSVDAWRRSSSDHMTPDEARELAHAILGAADLADQLNRERVTA